MSTPLMTRDEAVTLIRKIRNQHKKAYALQYLDWIDGKLPRFPNADRSNLGVMAEQAVWMLLAPYHTYRTLATH